MKITIVTILVVLIALTVVTPVFADDGTIKPACTANDGFFARLFGKCVEVDSRQNTASQQGDQLAKGMTESNPFSDNTWQATCKMYWMTPAELRNPEYKDTCEQSQYMPK